MHAVLWTRPAAARASKHSPQPPHTPTSRQQETASAPVPLTSAQGEKGPSFSFIPGLQQQEGHAEEANQPWTTECTHEAANCGPNSQARSSRPAYPEPLVVGQRGFAALPQCSKLPSTAQLSQWLSDNAVSTPSHSAATPCTADLSHLLFALPQCSNPLHSPPEPLAVWERGFPALLYIRQVDEHGGCAGRILIQRVVVRAVLLRKAICKQQTLQERVQVSANPHPVSRSASGTPGKGRLSALKRQRGQ